VRYRRRTHQGGVPAEHTRRRVPLTFPRPGVRTRTSGGTDTQCSDPARRARSEG
jgi:hypothetical protein